jgi:hypothetical protein
MYSAPNVVLDNLCRFAFALGCRNNEHSSVVLK